MNEPYFRRLAGAFTAGAARLRVIPYSYTVDEAAMSGLRAVAVALLGDDAEVLHPAITFGAESSASQMLPAADSGVLLTLALFGLAATPENENHGTFLKALRSASESARLAVLIDESGYRRRLGVQARADARLEERRNAWHTSAVRSHLRLRSSICRRQICARSSVTSSAFVATAPSV